MKKTKWILDRTFNVIDITDWLAVHIDVTTDQPRELWGLKPKFIDPLARFFWSAKLVFGPLPNDIWPPSLVIARGWANTLGQAGFAR